MANINYTATADLKSFSTWLTNNVDQSASTWDSTTQEGVLVLNSGVILIGQNAFKNCTDLLSVTIPNGIQSVTTDAFNNCSNLTTVTIDSTFTSYASSFANSPITTLNLGPNATSFTSSNWTGISTLAYINVDSNNSALTDGNGSNCIISKSSNRLMLGCKNTVIPNTVKDIFSNAFKDITDLTSINLPEGLLAIGESAFENCTNLITFTIPSTIYEISRRAFKNTAWWNSQSNGIIIKDNWAFGKNLNNFTGQCIIPDGVIGISLNDNTNNTYTSITLPSSLKYISSYCFEKSNSITEVTIPDGVKCLGYLAFNSSSITTINYNAINADLYIPTQTGATSPFGNNLSVFNIGNNVTYLRKGILKSKSLITSLTFPNSLEVIDEEALLSMSSLTEITLPESLTTIRRQAIAYCNNLKTLYYNSINASVDTTTFDSTALTRVVFGNSVISIPASLCRSKTSLTSVTFGNSVTNIGQYAFNGCTNLLSVTSLATTPPTLNTGNFGASGDTLKVLPSALSAYENNTSWRNAFTNIKSVPAITYTATADLKAYSYSGGTWCTTNVDQNASTWDSTTHEGILVLNDGVASIGQNAFRACTDLLTMELPEGITIIDQSAFNSCSKLKYIELPSTLTNINATAFWSNSGYVVYCKALTPPSLHGSNFSNPGPLYVDSSVVDTYKNNSSWSGKFTYILPWAGNGEITYESSADLSSYSQWLIDNTISSSYDSSTHTGTITVFPYEIGTSAFQACTTLTSITLTNIIRFNTSAFQACTSLTSINFPNIISINASAFSGCTSLTSIGFPSSLKSIANNAFNGCSNLMNFTIPSNCGFYRDSFLNCGWWNSQSDTVLYKDGYCIGYKSTKTTGELIINNEATTICSDAFRDCTGLTTLTIGNSVINIKSNAFQGCTGLTSIDLGNSVTSIGYYVFQGCTGLTSINFGNSLTSIGNSAFQGCTGLTTLTIGNSVTSIDGGAFSNCTGLTTLTIGNSVTNIGSNAIDRCTSLKTIFWNSTSTSFQLGYNWSGDSKNNITSIIFGDNVTVIPNAFSGFTGITSLSIPNSVTTISEYAFGNCTGLTTLTIGNSINNINNAVFKGCTNLTTVNWNATSPSTIWSNIFENTNITSIIFGDNVEKIPGCFSKTNITSLSIPNSVTNITTYAFKDCTRLTSIDFGNSLTTIGNSAFGNCTGLTSISLPNSLTTIGNSAFYGCSNLLSVTCKATTPPTLDSNNFTASDDTLYVLSSSKASYESNTSWRNAFTNIKGIYTVSTSAGDNGTITPTELVAEGESFTVTATPNAHYKVSHFVVDGIDVGTIDNYTFQNLDANHTIHVDFELITHTITATAFEGGAIVPSGAITVNETASQSFDIVPLEGYGILALFIDGTQIEPVETYTFTDVEADHTIDAMFYQLRVAGFNTQEMLDLDYLLQEYLEQNRKRD